MGRQIMWGKHSGLGREKKGQTHSDGHSDVWSPSRGYIHKEHGDYVLLIFPSLVLDRSYVLNGWGTNKYISLFEPHKTLRGDKALLQTVLFACWGQSHSCSIFLLPVHGKIHSPAPMQLSGVVVWFWLKECEWKWHSRKGFSCFSGLLQLILKLDADEAEP